MKTDKSYTEFERSLIDFVVGETCRDTLEEVSTKQISEHFGIPTNAVYATLKKIAKDGRLNPDSPIEYLAPVNGDNLSCAGWITTSDDNN